jgi:hypothetical protein
VFATNAYGPSPLSAASNSVTPAALVIGQSYAGGYYAGQISTAGNSVADYNLVVGPVASAQNSSIRYKNVNTDTTGANSVINGPQNTIDLVNNGDCPAANFCATVTAGGFNDWYMPAKNELEVCYYNLKPTTTNNQTGSGINANAVPARASNYTTGNPAQTSATDFRDTGAEDFAVAFYWASNKVDATYASVQNFGNGGQYGYKRTYIRSVRAIRRVAV